MSELNEEIDFQPDRHYNDRKNRAELNDALWDEEKEKKLSINWTIKLFEEFIDKRFNEYVEWKVFNRKIEGIDFETCNENVLDYLRDMAIEYCKKYPQVVITDKNDE
jgi:hypothetical protein